MPTASKYSSPTAGDRGPDPGDVGAANGQRHRDVHGQVAGAQVAHGALEEGRAAVEHDRRGEEQRDPAQDGVQLGAEVDVEFRPGGHGRHHRLEPQQAGDARAGAGPGGFRWPVVRWRGRLGRGGRRNRCGAARRAPGSAATARRPSARAGDGWTGSGALRRPPGKLRRCFSISQPQAAQLMPSISRVVSARSPSWRTKGCCTSARSYSASSSTSCTGQRFGVGRGFAAMLVIASPGPRRRSASATAWQPGQQNSRVSPSTTAVKRLPAGTGRAQW